MFDLKPVTYHWYQNEAMDASDRFFFDGDGEHVLQMPTGSGKTLTALKLAQDVINQGGNTLFLVPRKDLAIQTLRAALTHSFYPNQVGRIQGTWNEIDRPFTIATVQTLQQDERLAAFIKAHKGKRFSIIDDECQYALSPSSRKIFDALLDRDGRHIGISATPYRSDNVSLELIYPGGLAYTISPFDLILTGHLSPVDNYVFPTSADFSDIDVDDPDEKTQEEVWKRQKTSDRYEVAWEGWRNLAYGKRTIVLAHNLHDAYNFQRYFKAKGIASEYVTGGTPDEIREEYYNNLRKGILTVLTGFNVLTTGLDIVEIECVIWARATNFQGLYMQGVGRGLRLAPHINKDKLILIDLTDKHHSLIAMHKLIGNMEYAQHTNIKRALEEKVKQALSEEEISPLRALARLKEIHAYSSDIFKGQGWQKDRMTGDFVNDYGDYIVRAQKAFDGYQVVAHTKKAKEGSPLAAIGKPVQITAQPVPADVAMVKGNQYIQQLRAEQASRKVKNEAHTALMDGTSPHVNEPITQGQLEYLQKRRLSFRDQDITKMTQGDYGKIAAHLKQYGAAHKNGHHIHWTEAKGVRSWHDDPQAAKEKGETGEPGKRAGEKLEKKPA